MHVKTPELWICNCVRCALAGKMSSNNSKIWTSPLVLDQLLWWKICDC